MLGHCGKAKHPTVVAAIRQLFAAVSAVEARERLAGIVEALKGAAPKADRLLAAAEDELLAFTAFPREQWSRLRSTNLLERVNREIGRRSDVVGIYSNDAALIRLASALPVEQNEWLRATLPPGGVASLGARSREHGGDAGGGGTAGGLRTPRTTADDRGLAPRVGTLTL
jgi:transposase-like protein